jgi:hypothetical protein
MTQPATPPKRRPGFKPAGLPAQVVAKAPAPLTAPPPLHPNFMRDFFDQTGSMAPAVAPAAELFAGSLPTDVIKIPVVTTIASFVAYDVPVPVMEIPKLTDASVANAWVSPGTGYTVAPGDLTIGEGNRNAQRKKGSALASSLNDDNQSLAILGRDWREIQMIDNTTIPGGFLDLVPARDTHRIFVYRDSASMAFAINLTATDLQPGMKFMFVNLSAAETAGTNEQQTVTISAAGGTFTISFGGYTTVALAFNAIASVVQAALEALPSIGTNNVLVGLGGSVYTLTFRNALGNTNVAAVTTNASLLTGGANTAVVATTVPGVAAIGQLVIVAGAAGIAGNSINRLTLSKGAVVILQAVPASLAATIGANFIYTHKQGTVS